jgi:hypothetical protein
MQPGGRGDRPTGMKAADLTHPLTAARPLAAAAALACALAMASGLATAGCAGPPPRAGSPATAGSPVPASAIPRLTAIGGRAAAANGDTAPPWMTAVWMTAVLTTHAKALTSATPGDFVPGTGDIPVFLITMRGISWHLRPRGLREQWRRPAGTCPSSSTPRPSRCSTPA